MSKWIRRLVYMFLILSIFTGMDSKILYAEDNSPAVPEAILPQTLLQQSIQSVKLPDQAGKLNTASYEVQFAKDSKEFPYIDSIFSDRSGEHIIIVYQLKDNPYVNGKFQDRTIKIASIRVKDGKKVWDTVIAKKQFRQSIYSVQKNGEIFFTTQDDTTFYLHTINEKTGKITRTISQSHPKERTFLSWDYWLVDNNQLLMSYSVNNKSTLRYFDANGKLLKTRTVSGIVRGAQGNRILITDGDVFNYTLSVQDGKGKNIFKRSIANEGFIWETYFLPDLSVAIESKIKSEVDNVFRLVKYDASGKKQWQHTTSYNYSPYLLHGDQFVAILAYSKKVFLLNNQGTPTNLLFGTEDDGIDLRNNEMYFSGQDTRIANAKTMEWVAGVQYKGSWTQFAWLGNQKLAIADTDNNIIAVIRIKSN